VTKEHKKLGGKKEEGMKPVATAQRSVPGNCLGFKEEKKAKNHESREVAAKGKKEKESIVFPARIDKNSARAKLSEKEETHVFS